MAESKHPHFAIPKELVRDEPAGTGGGGATITRADYAAHGAYLRTRVSEFRMAASRTRDSGITSHYYLEVNTPKDIPIKNERQRLSQVGVEVIAPSLVDPSSATARISKAALNGLDARIE